MSTPVPVEWSTVYEPESGCVYRRDLIYVFSDAGSHIGGPGFMDLAEARREVLARHLDPDEMAEHFSANPADLGIVRLVAMTGDDYVLNSGTEDFVFDRPEDQPMTV